jgi:hypothetical protein
MHTAVMKKVATDDARERLALLEETETDTEPPPDDDEVDEPWVELEVVACVATGAGGMLEMGGTPGVLLATCMHAFCEGFMRVKIAYRSSGVVVIHGAAVG